MAARSRGGGGPWPRLAAMAVLLLRCLAPAAAHTEVVFQGYLVDRWSWNQANHVGRDGIRLDIAPQHHTVQSMTDFAASRTGGFALVSQQPSGTYAVQYTLDVTGNTNALAWLDAIKASGGGAGKNVMVEASGLAHGSPPELLMATFALPGVAPAMVGGPSGAQLVVGELVSGYVLSTKVDNAANTITIKVQNNKNAWISFGLTTPGGGMTGGGTGAEIYVCTSTGLKMFWVTEHGTPTDGVAVDGECMVMDGYVHMAFVKELQNGGARRHADAGPHMHVTPGIMQSVIYAYGATGDLTMAREHVVRGERSLDLGDLSKGMVVVGRSGQWTLWIHLVFMSLAWGWALPWGAAIAARAKAVIGQPVGQWFRVHVRFQAAGWLLSLTGFAFALAHCQLFSGHFRHPHTIIGIVAVSLCFLQPFNALLRPPPTPPGGKPTTARVAWEIVHKGLGWGVVLLGAANVIVGAKLSLDLGYDAACAGVALGIGCAGILSALAYALLASAAPQNLVSRAIVGAGRGGGGHEAPPPQDGKQPNGDAVRAPVWTPPGPGPARAGYAT